MLTDLGEGRNNNTIIIGDINNPLSAMDRSHNQKINKEALDLSYLLVQMDLTDKYRTFHPIVAAYTLFSSVHRHYIG